MDEVIDLLQAWGLPELSASFIKNEINIQSLAALSCEEIKELIPQVGPRALFSRCWKIWQADFLSNSLNISTAADMSSCNISLSDISVITIEGQQVEQERQSLNVTRSSNEHVHEQVQPVAINLDAASISTGCTDNLYFSYDAVEDNILFKLLKENFETSSLVNFVGKALENDSARNLLASIICKQILKENKNLPITSVIYNKWTKEIKTIFPKERITTYYIPPCITAQGVTHQARGKLVSQLLNIRRKYQKLGVLEVKEKRHPIPQSSNQVALSLRPPARVNAQQNNNINEDLAWLRSSSEPWTLVELKWNDTLEKRSDDLRKITHSIEQYFDEYPALKKPMGYKLLVSDFENNYPEYMNNFYLNFPAVKNTLIELLKKKQTKDIYCNEVVQLADGSSEENHNIAAILSLPELINSNIITLPVRAADGSSSSKTDSPTPAKKKKIKDNKWKPTKPEIREAFVLHVHDDSYLKLVLTKRQQKISDKGFTPQPYVVIVGPNIFSIKSYFVVINSNIFYNLPNILASIDTCFKITWALNLEYPPPSYGPWLFLQKGLYKLTSSYDKGSTSVESLMTDCNLTN